MNLSNTATDFSYSPISTVRDGEKVKHWFRSDRFFTVDNKWYFTTRENRDIGPFNNRSEASHSLALFIDCIENQELDIDHAVSVAVGGKWALSYFQ